MQTPNFKGRHDNPELLDIPRYRRILADLCRLPSRIICHRFGVTGSCHEKGTYRGRHDSFPAGNPIQLSPSRVAVVVHTDCQGWRQREPASFRFHLTLLPGPPAQHVKPRRQDCGRWRPAHVDGCLCNELVMYAQNNSSNANYVAQPHQAASMAELELGCSAQPPRL